MLTPLSGVIACTDWERGQLGVTGSGPNQLTVPVPKTWLPHRQVLITDRANERIIEIAVATKRSLANGTTDVSGSDHDQLTTPKCAELLENGHILSGDANNCLPTPVRLKSGNH